MSLHGIFFQQWPAVVAIYEMGYLPADEEYQEVPPEIYAACERQGMDVSKRLYTIVPLYGDYQLSYNEIGLLSEDEIPILKSAADFLRRCAKDANCDSESSDDILAAAATKLPPVFTKNSKFARDSIKESENDTYGQN